jgi:hypothetical protein
MLEPFKPAEPDKNGISQITMVQDPDQKAFVATVDNKWVAVAQNKDDLTAYMARTDSFAAKASPDIKKVFDVNDLVVWGDVQKLSIGADKAIDDARTDISGMLELAAVAGTQDPVAGALQKQTVNALFAFAKQFLKDADSTMVTVRLTDSGATLGVAGDFKGDSTIARFVAAQKSAKPVTLQGLPGAGSGFLAAGAANWDSATMASALDNFSQQLLADETISKDKRAGDIKKSLELERQILEISTGASFVLLDPPAGGENGFIAGVALIETKDPAKFRDLQSQMLQSNFLNDSMNPDIKQTTSVTPDAVTIKGVKLSKFNIKLSLREETADKPINEANKMVLPMLQKVYGKEGLTAYFGTVGNRGIVIYGSDPGTLEAGVAAAQSNSNELAATPSIAATKDQLVANPIGVAYLPVTRWITLASSIMRPPAAGEPGPSPAILNAPPIVMSAGITNNMVTAEIHVPIATVTGIQEAYGRLQRAFGGGQ